MFGRHDVAKAQTLRLCDELLSATAAARIFALAGDHEHVRSVGDSKIGAASVARHARRRLMAILDAVLRAEESKRRALALRRNTRLLLHLIAELNVECLIADATRLK